MTWNPIETAPRDGTEVLLWYPGYRQKVWAGSYNRYERYVNGKLTGQHSGWAIPRDLLLSVKECDPTHWMPLPEPPEEQSEAQNAGKT